MSDDDGSPEAQTQKKCWSIQIARDVSAVVIATFELDFIYRKKASIDPFEQNPRSEAMISLLLP